MSSELFRDEERKLLEKIKKKPSKKITNNELDLIANLIRKHVVAMVSNANSGHPGGPLGLAEIYAVLYFRLLKHRPEDPKWEGRDRLLLSNGHVCAVRYASMALSGYFDMQELMTFRRLGTRLQGHPSTRYLDGLENSSGSLGQGLSNASGLALGLKAQKSKSRVFVGMSDGECQEGMIWEAAMAASHYKLNNLTSFLDYNNIQIDGFVNDVMNIGDIRAKFKSFGWDVKMTSGHKIKNIQEAFDWSTKKSKQPRIIIFKTVLGKGVSFMENQPGWHGVSPKPGQKDQALTELNKISDKVIKKIKKDNEPKKKKK